MATTTPTIVILGASFAGIPTTHKLLRALPSEYKVILVNPSTHIFWNIAAPRAVARDNQFSTDNADVFAPITPGFAAYAEDRFEFIQGKASAVDAATNKVTIKSVDDEGVEGAERVVEYAHLVVATGAAGAGAWPFKAVGTHVQTAKALKDCQVKIEAAKTIVLSGAGPTGVETAGEIATLYKGKGKKIILLSSGERCLPMVREDVGLTAQKLLEGLGVEVHVGVKVTTEVAGDEGLTLTLSNGETMVTDLHIPTYGITPNTQFLPAELLDESGSVKVSAHMQSTVQANIWAIGDAAAVKQKKTITTKPMLEAAVENILAVVGGKGEEAFKEYKDEETPMVVPVGGGFAMGTGILNKWKVWGVLVWFVKGRKYFVANAKNVALGKVYGGGQTV
ncbi:hypothetical protein BZA05DRAFT_407185 [Tricharina praecox]|uniref:uncharacterized protein n=1 Tax=Tricharina praecox TaxID=43433 RepID=UPI00221EE8DB|nr:uncharacterized protein BZA05DRAFT_407185 [Tricharina praecox]KAI5846187.1 hypothetical protein BZA05DRAFT_407185 [Tricharina praecox]